MTLPHVFFTDQIVINCQADQILLTSMYVVFYFNCIEIKILIFSFLLLRVIIRVLISLFIIQLLLFITVGVKFLCLYLTLSLYPAILVLTVIFISIVLKSIFLFLIFLYYVGDVDIMYPKWRDIIFNKSDVII